MGRRYNFFYPFLFALILAAGMILGTLFQGSGQVNTPKKVDPAEKIDHVISYILSSYVDDVNENKLTEDAIRSMLEDLDPHSVYISANELKEMNEPLEGNFEGIGVEFNILKDTIIVVSPISGGPSEALGIRAGDKIVKIEGENVAGIGITNSDVINKLRGEKGSEVTISIKRHGQKKLIEYTIKRDKIPIFSIDASYMIDQNTGYIKLNRFSANTVEEFHEALGKLRDSGLQQLILDLRGNPGGFLNASIKVADELLPDGQVIVYTQGRARPKEVYRATANGEFESGKLVILIDEGSASASEILSGAIQDHDRGLIVGRRSFGKGLVQEPYMLEDGSALRLTVARYYTPSGRSIQKPYNNGIEAYNHDIINRYESGEMVNKDSVQVNDSLSYTTTSGRTVYGGGGIMPDVFVPIDTSHNSEFLDNLVVNGLLNQYALNYVDKNRKTLKSKYANVDDFESNFTFDGKMESDFINFAKQNKVTYQADEYKRSEKMIVTQIKALIARQIWNNDAYYKIANKINRTYLKAIESLKGNTFADKGIKN